MRLTVAGGNKQKSERKKCTKKRNHKRKSAFFSNHTVVYIRPILIVAMKEEAKTLCVCGPHLTKGNKTKKKERKNQEKPRKAKKMHH